MDSAQISSLLHRAEQLIHLADAARGLQQDLRPTPALQVNTVATLGDETSRIQLLTPQALHWSPNFYLRTFFEGMGAEDQLGSFIASAAVIPLTD